MLNFVTIKGNLQIITSHAICLWYNGLFTKFKGAVWAF